MGFFHEPLTQTVGLKVLNCRHEAIGTERGAVINHPELFIEAVADEFAEACRTFDILDKEIEIAGG